LTRIEVLRYIDGDQCEGVVVLKRWFSRTKERGVEFCERCGVVCGSACRAFGVRESAVQSALRQGRGPL
jgi:hypothetical protein